MSSKYEMQEIIRVNHAGEYGAQRIYQGQIDIFKMKKDHDSLKLVEHMKEQEDSHFRYFDKKLIDYEIRPTLMQPIWSLCGYLLGASTAFISKKAAMVCTVAVEEVIDEHYQDQIKNLENCNDDIKEKIEQFRQEELEHKDIAIDNEAKESLIYKPLSFLVKKASKLAIFISKKI